MDASSYAPAPLTPAPPRIDAGERMPADADAVAALDAVAMRGAQAEALGSVAPGEGVLAPNTDAAAGLQLRLAGARLRRIDVALLTALGVERVLVRQPRVRMVRVGAGKIIEGAAALIAAAIDGESGIAVQDDMALEAALTDDGEDMVVAIGGTGSGRNDKSVRTLARVGHVAFHGIGITPGETTAIGFSGPRPVLLLPGRIDAALAGWLTVGRRMLARRAFRLIEEQPFAAELARKIASPLGLAEVVAVRRRLGKVEPVAQGYLLDAGAGARRGLDPHSGRQRGPSGRRARRGEAVAMSNDQIRRRAESELLAAVRAAARQEQFLEVVSAEEAKKRFEAHLDLTPAARRARHARGRARPRAGGRSRGADRRAAVRPRQCRRLRAARRGFGGRRGERAEAARAERRGDRLRPCAQGRGQARHRDHASPPAAWCRAAPTPW